MNNLFQYTKTEGQGWLVEKPGMEIPTPPKWEDVPSKYKEFLKSMSEYDKYIATLRRFKYDYPDLKKEMELGKDFRVETINGPEFSKITGKPSIVANYTQEVAIPYQHTADEMLTDFDKGFLVGWEACQKEYASSYQSIKEVEVLKKQYYDLGLMAERIIWKDKVEKLCREAYIDARTIYSNTIVNDWWPEFKLHNNL